MSRSFKGFKIGQRNNKVWVEFDRAYKNEDGRRYYRFNCHIEPLLCVSDNNVYQMKFKDSTYVISEFTVIADKSGKYIDSVRLGNQNHPHKDPRNGFLCIGSFEGKALKPETIKHLVFHCILKYNEMDCFCVPDIRIAEKYGQIMEGNKCLIS